MTEYTSFEIKSTDPYSQQPLKIIKKLKSHQLASLYKATLLEELGIINYNVANYSLSNSPITFKSNIGILGDIVGYGKTLLALSIVSHVPLNKIHINNNVDRTYTNNSQYSYISYSTINKIESENIINSTLVIVPRGPVYNQWEYSIKNDTCLRYLAIENLNYIKKYLPKDNCTPKELITYFSKFDIILIKNTTYDTLYSYYNKNILRSWKRIMVDEAHESNPSKLSKLYYYQLWLISANYDLIYNIINSLNGNRLPVQVIDMMLVKCEKEFVKSSFSIPLPTELYYLCKSNRHYDIVKDFISKNVLDKLNANDYVGAIRDLGGKSETEHNMIDLISKELNRELTNKENEKTYVSSLDIPSDNKILRIKNIDSDIVTIKNKIQDLTNRISELSNKVCPICMENMDKPIVLECTHSYCCTCIMEWINKKQTCINCPQCRKIIDVTKIIIVEEPLANTVVKKKEKEFSKEETLLKIIKKKPKGKYLVFSNYDSSFINIINKLNGCGISNSELKGNTNHMMNVLTDFKEGRLSVILLNTHYAGSGIDISFATDVILYHDMKTLKHQAIGRAQRVGRTDNLTVHHLCYQDEMPKE